MSAFVEEDMQMVELRTFWRSRHGSRSNPILQSEQYPLILENEREILWLFNVGDLRNRIILNPVFPIMAYRTFLYSSHIDFPETRVGERILLPTGRIILPGGEEYTTTARYYLLNEPGIYQLPLSEGESRYLATNIDYKFSDYERLEPASYRDVNLYFPEDNWQEEILRSRYGFEIWKILFVLVLILIVLEILIVKKQEKRGKA
jgi:hypothetical protein